MKYLGNWSWNLLIESDKKFEIIGHSAAIGLVMSEFNKNRLLHAHLILGPCGCGKNKFSQVFAAMANCERNLSLRDKKIEISQGDQLCCGVCNSCLKMASNSHPDFSLIAPSNGTIKIDQIRQLKSIIARKPTEGTYKVCLIDGADKMTEEAQNSLLKVLEETLGDALIVLTAENKSKLLPTIISRCNLITLGGSEIPLVEAWLISSCGASLEQSKLFSRLSAGLCGLAYNFLKDENYLVMRRKIIEKINALISQRDSVLAINTSENFGEMVKDLKDEEGSIENYQIDSQEAIIDLVAGYFSDILSYKTTNSIENIQNIDFADEVVKMSDCISLDECRKAVQEALHTAYAIRCRANPRLAIDAFMLSLCVRHAG